MRAVVCGLVLACVVSGAARAQEAAGAEAPVAVPPAATGMASQPERYSAAFAGGGGPLLVLDETLLGLVTGVVVGRSAGINPDQAFLSVVGGTVVLGGLGFTYSYFVPVGHREAVLGTFASFAGFLLGAGINSYAHTAPGLGQGLTVLGAGQAAIATAVLATLGGQDISGSDLAVVSAAGGWGALLSLFAVGAVTPKGATADFRPVLFMPAVGMALGGVVAALTEVKGERLPALTMLPLGVGLGFYGLGLAMNAPQSGAAVGILSTAATLGLMLVFGPSPLEETVVAAAAGRDGAGQLVAVPVALPTGPRGEQVAVGGGMALAF